MKGHALTNYVQYCQALLVPPKWTWSQIPRGSSLSSRESSQESLICLSYCYTQGALKLWRELNAYLGFTSLEWEDRAESIRPVKAVIFNRIFVDKQFVLTMKLGEWSPKDMMYKSMNKDIMDKISKEREWEH